MATNEANHGLSFNEMKALGAEWTRERPAILTIYPHGIRAVSLHSGRWSDEKALRCGVPRRTRPLLVHDVATGRTELVYLKSTKTYGDEWLTAYPEPDYSREQREKSAARAQARREERQRTRRDERLRADAAKRAAAYGAAAHEAN
jgi:hypothetical protein